MKTYKIWVEVEEYDDETEAYQTLDQMNAGFHVGSDEDVALTIADRLNSIGESLVLTYEDGVNDGKKKGRRVRNVNPAIKQPS